MRKSTVVILLKYIAVSLLIAVFLVAPAVAQSSVPGKVLTASESVFRIISEYRDGYGSGSGFVVSSKDGFEYIATNYHVVDDNPTRIIIVSKNGDEINADIVAKDTKKDIAVLRCKLDIDVSPVALNSNGVDKGDAVYAVGFPGAADDLSETIAYSDNDVTITDGIASSIRDGITNGGANVTIIQTTAPINPGNSGGPLLNEKGEVIGINTYGSTDASVQGIYWAISVEELIQLMKNNDIPFVSDSGFSVVYICAICGGVSAVALIVVLSIKRRKKAFTTTRKNGQQAQMKFCRKCGSVIIANASFCNKCGTRIKGE